MRISIILLGVFSLCCLSSLKAADPTWWTDSATAIIDPNASHAIDDNYRSVNLGQLKNFATKAKQRLDAVLPGGAGPAVIARLAEFSGSLESNYSPVNLGQVKYVAEPFYNRLREAGYNLKGNLVTQGYPASWPHDTPWDPNTPVSENCAPANIGQLKMVFSFDPEDESLITIRYVDGTVPSSGDGTTPQTAFKTIQEAADATSAKDSNGNYLLPLPIKIKIKGSSEPYRETIALLRGGDSHTERIIYEGDGNVTICGSEPLTGDWVFETEVEDDPQTIAREVEGTIYSCPYPYMGSQWLPDGISGYEVPSSYNPNPPFDHSFDWLHSDLISVDGRLLLLVDKLDYDENLPYYTALDTSLWSFYIEDRDLSSTSKIYIKLPNDIDPNSAEIEVGHPTRSILFNSKGSWTDYHYITLSGLHFLHAANQPEGSWAMVRTGDNWIVKDCIIEGSNGTGLVTGGNDVEVLRCRITRHGGNSFSIGWPKSNVKLKDCEFSFNNWRGYNPSHESSNKVYAHKGMVIKNCKSFWNCGPGIWVDHKNINTKILDCEVFGNYGLDKDSQGAGIFIEISYGPTEIHKNHIYSNTGAGVYVAESPDVAIEENVFADNSVAFGVRFLNRPEYIWPPHNYLNPSQPDPPFDLQNVSFERNTVYEQRDAVLRTDHYKTTDPLAWESDEANIQVDENNYFHTIFTQAQPSQIAKYAARRFDWTNMWVYSSLSYARGNLGFDSSATSITQPFDKVTVPTFRLLYKYPKKADPNDPRDDPSLPNGDPRPPDEYPSTLVPSPPSAPTPGDYIIPVFHRDEIAGQGTPAVTCKLYDTIGQFITVSLPTSATQELIAHIPRVPLTRPVYLRIHVANSTTKIVSSDLFNPEPPPGVGGTKTHRSEMGYPHAHWFAGAAPLSISAGDILFCYVYIDPTRPPRQIILEWKTDGEHPWEHRAFWGESISYSNTPLGPGKRDMNTVGPALEPGKWLRLEVPAELVNLHNTQINGMQFRLFYGRDDYDFYEPGGGRVWWGAAGKRAADGFSDEIWVGGVSLLPNGAITDAYADRWHWVSGSVEAP